LFAHLTPGPLMGVNHLSLSVERVQLAALRSDVQLAEWAVIDRSTSS